MPCCQVLVLASAGDVASFGCFAAVVGGIVIIMLVIGSSQRKLANDAWARVGTAAGLRFQEASTWGHPRLHGVIHEHAVEVDTYTAGSGKSKQTYTRATVHYPSLGLGLNLRREGFLSGISKMFGMSDDVEIGDSAFDDEIIVQGNPLRLREFLNSARRMRIRRYFNNYPMSTISDIRVTCVMRGVTRDAGRLRQMINDSVNLAWHLTGDREADVNLNEALQAHNEGRNEEALELVRRRSATELFPEPIVAELAPGQTVEAELVEERLVEGELLSLAGREAEAHDVFQLARRGAPYDEEIAEWAEQPTAGPKSDIAEAEPVVDGPVAKTGLESQSPGDLSRDLFDGQRTSYQISHDFDQRYAGVAIRWTGKVKRVESYHYDFVFGSEPGTKAVVAVAELANVVYGDRTVSAIVQFPPGDYERLRGLDRDEVTFRGKLHKVDALMRNIYVKEGVLE